MDNLFKTLLVNSVLQGKNPNAWKGDCVMGSVNKSLSWLARERCKSRLTMDDIASLLPEQRIVSKCWVVSGSEVDRIDVRLGNLSLRFIFEPEKTYLQMELNNYLLERKEYDISFVDARHVVQRISGVDSDVSQFEAEWPDFVRLCIKTARSLEMRTAAINGYMTSCLAGTGLAYNVRTTSECIVVSLVAPERLELTTSIVDSDDIAAKINALVEQMQQKLQNTL